MENKIQLTNKNIDDVYRFMHGPNSIQITCKRAEDAWYDYENMVKDIGLLIKGTNQRMRIGKTLLKTDSGEFIIEQ